MNTMMSALMSGPQFDVYNKQVDVRKVTDIGGKRFHPGAKKTYANIHRTKGSALKNRRCMLYFHGGGAVAGSPE